MHQLEAEQVARRAVDLARRLGSDTPNEFRAPWAHSLFYMVSGQTRWEIRLGAQCLGLAERIRDRPSWICELVYGQLPALAWRLADGSFPSRARYRGIRPRAGASRRGHLRVRSGCIMSVVPRPCSWHLGFPAQGLILARRTQSRRARAARQPFGITWALSWGAALYQLCGDAVRTEQVTREAWIYRLSKYFHSMQRTQWFSAVGQRSSGAR